MCSGASLFRGDDMRSALICLDFGALKIWERVTTLSFKSIHRDLRTIGG